MKRVLSSSLKGVAMKSSDWETSDIIISTGNNNNNNNQPSRQLRSRSNSDASRRMNIHSFNSFFEQPDLRSSYKTSDAAAATERKDSRTSSSLLTLDADEQDETNIATASSKRNSKRTYEDDDDTEVIITVNTFREKKSKQLDAPRHLSTADLDTLKANDPFMYYSIPSVKKAVWEGRDVDFDVDLGRPVTRCSAVSFENVNDFDVGLSYDESRSNVNESNGDRKKDDLFLSFFGVDCQ